MRIAGNGSFPRPRSFLNVNHGNLKALIAKADVIHTIPVNGDVKPLKRSKRMSEIEGWLLQVTRGDPRDGEQSVDMYAAWVASEDDAIELVAKTFSLTEEELVAIVDTLPAESLSKLGLKPGEACPFSEELVAD